ncbi:hypothetical protein WOLCODRAFT_152108 [Wolfiporia cocos MD-104 SS10]|uniref:Uncharacterized protein n=1 Tax=Wolfiporia cocos (strain MD-104) TaxID=742152 RepID=A0A2H3JW53_WOLCO|nr:hypothetical protein WOLCODRAFT_152108 [Wolfiporia cocos MD-104 SS10]
MQSRMDSEQCQRQIRELDSRGPSLLCPGTRGTADTSAREQPTAPRSAVSHKVCPRSLAALTSGLGLEWRVADPRDNMPTSAARLRAHSGSHMPAIATDAYASDIRAASRDAQATLQSFNSETAPSGFAGIPGPGSCEDLGGGTTIQGLLPTANIFAPPSVLWRSLCSSRLGGRVSASPAPGAGSGAGTESRRRRALGGSRRYADVAPGAPEPVY